MRIINYLCLLSVTLFTSNAAPWDFPHRVIPVSDRPPPPVARLNPPPAARPNPPAAAGPGPAARYIPKPQNGNQWNSNLRLGPRPRDRGVFHIANPQQTTQEVDMMFKRWGWSPTEVQHIPGDFEPFAQAIGWNMRNFQPGTFSL